MGGVLSYGIEKSSENRLPPLDGTISLPCLDQQGSITYDKWGVPHIFAKSRKDGYRLQGFIHAQHRCFQLIQTQLVVRGELSKIIGNSAKSIDIFSRTCNFYGLAREDWSYINMNQNKYKYSIEMVNCYVEGINAWLTHPLFERPVELSTLLLNYDPTVSLFTPSDVFAIGRLLGLKMSVGWNSKMLSTLLIQTVGVQNAEWFCCGFDTNKIYQCPYNDGSGKQNINNFYLNLKNIGKLLQKKNQPIMGIKHSYFNNKKKYVSPNKSDNDIDQKSVSDIDLDPVVLDPMKPGQGSNAWVVSGKYTDCGKPLLANDPHLGLNVPNIFLYCSLTVESGANNASDDIKNNDDNDNNNEDIHWTGVQVVGTPGISIGHTDYCAIGITVGACDTSDIFVERFQNKDSNKYYVDGQLIDCIIRKEIIQIKGEDDYILNVRETKHGSILEPTDFDKNIENGPYAYNIDDNKDDNNDNKYYLRYALCATFLQHRDNIINTPIEIAHDLLNSTNIKSMCGYLRKISFPNLNFVLADNSGNYGWTTNGLIPIRGSINTYNPILPIPGWLSKYDWCGYIPQDELPKNINSKCGYSVSCNNKMIDDDKYEHYLGFAFSMGYRAKRATELIDNMLIKNERITLEYFQKMQLDVFDGSAQEMIDNVLKKFDINKMISNHRIVLENCSQNFVLNCIIPKEIRNNDFIDINYYNDKLNRIKAEYAWNKLNKWNFEYTIDSLSAPIYDTFLMILFRRIVLTGIYKSYYDKSDNKKDDNYTFKLESSALKFGENILRNVYHNVFNGVTAYFTKQSGMALSILNNGSCWWINNYMNKENLIIMSLIDSIDCIKYWIKTDDKSKWIWGNLHCIEIFHPFSAKIGSSPFNSKSYPISGSKHSLNMIRGNLENLNNNPLKVIKSACPVWRQVINCGDWTKSMCILPLGTSGQVASKYYQNQLKLYAEQQYIPMLWTKKQINDNKSSKLICDPLRSIDDDKSDCIIL